VKKIHVAAVEVVRKKNERQDETQFITRIDGFLSVFQLLRKKK
jgi:hypothetical protein